MCVCIYKQTCNYTYFLVMRLQAHFAINLFCCFWYILLEKNEKIFRILILENVGRKGPMTSFSLQRARRQGDLSMEVYFSPFVGDHTPVKVPRAPNL